MTGSAGASRRRGGRHRTETVATSIPGPVPRGHDGSAACGHTASGPRAPAASGQATSRYGGRVPAAGARAGKRAARHLAEPRRDIRRRGIRRRGIRRQGAAVLRLMALGWRTNWPGLIGVPLAVAALVAGSASGIAGLYSTLESRAAYVATIGASAATQAFNGRGYGLTSLGGITAYEIGFFGQLLLPTLALGLALRHTRREEEAGRIELLSAGRIPRGGPLAAATLLTLGSCLAAGAAGALGAWLAGLPLAGSAWYGAGLAGLLGFFAAAGLLTAQLTPSTRTAGTLCGALVGVTFGVRAVVDGRDWSAVWLSPLGWLAEVRPFDEPQWWPLIAYGMGAAMLVPAAFVASSRRDLGAGLIAPRPGPATARPRLRSPAALAWRLTQPGALGWAALAVLWAATFGGLTGQMVDLIEANPSILAAMGLTEATDLVTGMAMLVVAVAAMGGGAQAACRLSQEETSGRWGLTLAARIPRTRSWVAWGFIAAAQAGTILLAGAVALAAGTAWSTGEGGAARPMLAAAVGYAVPVLAVTVAALGLGALRPSWSRAAWIVVVWSATVGMLAETLRLPNWSRSLSPLDLVGSLPTEDPSLPAIAGLAVGIVLMVLACRWRVAVRDLAA